MKALKIFLACVMFMGILAYVEAPSVIRAFAPAHSKELEQKAKKFCEGLSSRTDEALCEGGYYLCYDPKTEYYSTSDCADIRDREK